MKHLQLLFSFLEVPFDIVAIVISFGLAYLYRLQTPYTYIWQFNDYLKFVLITLPFWIIIFALGGMYNPKRAKGFWQEFVRAFLNVSAGINIIIVWLFLTKTEFFSRLIVLYAWVIAVVLISLFRWLLRILQTYLLKFNIGVSRVLLIGKNETVRKLADLFQNKRRYGLKVVKIIDPAGIEKLEQILAKLKIDEIILADENINENQALKVIEYCHSGGLDFRMVPNTFRSRSANLEFQMLDSIPLVQIKRTPLDGWGKIIKRLMDLILSLIFLIITSPLFLLFAILIKLTSPGGPVFFVQKRVGLRKEFGCLKFRTMVPNAHKVHNEYIKKYGNMFKLKDDPRVTKIGKFLRRYSLDELPQLINIFKGEMSLVGPRPPMPEEVKYYSTFQKRRLGIKPGLTGLWQVSGRSDVDFNEWVRLDVYYIENWSLWLDLGIILKTFGAVLKRKGAY